MKTGPCFKDMKRFNCSVYIFFKKLICSEMKPLYNYNTFKILGYREYVMRVLFCGQCYESMQYCWIIYLLVETCFDFVWKKWFFIRRSKRFLGFFCPAGPSYEDFTFAFGDIKIEKQKFHSSKSAMKNLDIHEILIFDEFT